MLPPRVPASGAFFPRSSQTSGGDRTRAVVESTSTLTQHGDRNIRHRPPFTAFPRRVASSRDDDTSKHHRRPSLFCCRHISNHRNVVGYCKHLTNCDLKESNFSALFKDQVLVLSYIGSMARSIVEKKVIKIDVSSDTVCPWCFVGKQNLQKAMDSAKDQFDFEVRWHPFFLNPNAPKEGVRKTDFYKQKFGPAQYEGIISRMTKVFQSLGFQYDTSGLTGNTMDSHRLITYASTQGYDKQNALVEELFLNYFCQGKYIGDRQVLLDAAQKVGIGGAAELLEDPRKGIKEVEEEFEEYSSGINGVPHFVINGKHKLSGGQPPEVFLKAFEAVANDASL